MENLNYAPSAIKNNMSTKVLLNFETERKKELERRRKLRILQVRQQANDFVSKIRDNIRAETIHQRKKLLQSKKKQSQQCQLAELATLNELYKLCLETVGEGHREAAKQPNMNELKAIELAQITADANMRGVKARRNQRENKELHRQIAEAPVKQKNLSRNRENLRSYFVSSLPKESIGVGERSRLTKNSHITSSKPNTGTHILQEVPSNLWNQQPNTQSVAESVVKEIRKQPTSIKTKDSGQVKNQTGVSLEPHNQLVEACSSPRTVVTKDCPCDYVVCGCHDSPKPSPIRRRCRSVPGSVSSESIYGIDDIRPKQPKPRTRSCSPLSVRTLNYRDIGNVYEATERSFARVTHHSIPPKATEKNSEQTSKTADVLLISERNETEEVKKKTKERSTKALQRERLKIEFKQLLQDLGNLNREKQKTKSKVTVYQRDRDITAKNETKQRKLTNAFEELLHTLDPSSHKNTGNSLQDFGKDKTTPGQFDELSPPTLNLAKYHQIKMTTRPRSLIKRITSVEEVTVSQTSRAEDMQSPQSRGGATGATSGWSSSAPPRTPSPKRDQSPTVTVESNPSGNIHLTIKVKDTPHKKKCKRVAAPSSSTSNFSPPENLSPSLKDRPHKKKCKSVAAPSSSTSYFSPPENLSPSQQLMLDALLIQVNKQALSEDLRLYIDKLLHLSRESIDRLHSQDRVDPVRSPVDLDEEMAELGVMTEEYIDRVHTLIDMFDSLEPIQSPERMFSPPPSAGPTSHPLPSRIPTPIRQQQPAAPPPPSPIQQPARGIRTRTPSPGSGRRIPRKPTTPPMQRRTPPVTPRQPQPPPDSAQSRIPISPQYQSPQPQSRQATPVPNSGRTQIQTPFQLSSNLLPDPRDVFGQPPASAHPALSPIAESPEGRRGTPGQVGFAEPTEAFGADFGGQFGGGGPEDWGNMGFADEDFNTGADAILQSEAPDDDAVDYPEDFPPPTDVFGPGFDWSAANLSPPKWPQSFPGRSLGGHDMSDRDHIAIDSSFDMSAVKQPLNVDRINEIRRKLSKICNDQYRVVIEMLQQDNAKDEYQFGNLLKRVISDPFEDPNATLAPVGYGPPERQKVSQSPTRSPPAPRRPASVDTKMSQSPTRSLPAPRRQASVDEKIDNMAVMSMLAKSLGNKSPPMTNFDEVD